MGNEQEQGPLTTVLATSLGEIGLSPRDEATAALALIYARDIDMAGDLSKLGPQLLKVLTELQMTPRSRAVAQRGGPASEHAAPASRLDELRARRARKYGAADMDATAP